MEPRDLISALKEMNQMRGSAFLRYLQSELDDVRTQMMNCTEEVHLRWMQGEAQRLCSLISEIEGAGSRLNRLTAPRTDMSKAF